SVDGATRTRLHVEPVLQHERDDDAAPREAERQPEKKSLVLEHAGQVWQPEVGHGGSYRPPAGRQNGHLPCPETRGAANAAPRWSGRAPDQACSVSTLGSPLLPGGADSV